MNDALFLLVLNVVEGISSPVYHNAKIKHLNEKGRYKTPGHELLAAV